MTVHFYAVRPTDPPLGVRTWGRFFLTTDGTLGIVSDYGNYGYWWTHPGCEIRQFLIGCEPDYIIGKLAGGATEYDAEETGRRIKREILRLRRTRDLSQKGARDEYELLARHDAVSDQRLLFLWYEETRLHEVVEVVSELFVYSKPFQLQGFMKVLWPAFIAKLEEELAAEALPAEETQCP